MAHHRKNFTEDQLRFAATVRCPCGALLQELECVPMPDEIVNLANLLRSAIEGKR